MIYYASASKFLENIFQRESIFMSQSLLKSESVPLCRMPGSLQDKSMLFLDMEKHGNYGQTWKTCTNRLCLEQKSCWSLFLLCSGPKFLVIYQSIRADSFFFFFLDIGVFTKLLSWMDSLINNGNLLHLSLNRGTDRVSLLFCLLFLWFLNICHCGLSVTLASLSNMSGQIC